MKLLMMLLLLCPGTSHSDPKASDNRIVYQNSEGKVSIICPSDESGLSIGQIKNKDVPDGVQFKIVPFHLIPSDRSNRNQWTYDPSKSNGIDPNDVIVNPGAGVK